MNAILTQDKKHIISAEALEHIEVSGTEIYAHTIGGAKVLLGKYKNEVCAERVMCFIAFGLTTEKFKTVALPPEGLINDSEAKFTRIEVSPDFKKIIEKFLGGDRS